MYFGIDRCFAIAALAFVVLACEPDAFAQSGPSPAADEDSGVIRSAATVSDGIYTEEQSERGELEYMRTCKKCHQRDLMGDFIEDAPPLIGDDFLAEWNPWTVGDLFEFLTTDMPPKPKDRRDITAQNYADILAFILMKNGYPSGDADLAAGYEPLAEIEMNPGK